MTIDKLPSSNTHSHTVTKQQHTYSLFLCIVTLHREKPHHALECDISNPCLLLRLFLAMDPLHGEISRAMRNRGVELYIPGEHEALCWDMLDLKTLLHTVGVIGDCVCDLLMSIHAEIKATIWGTCGASRHVTPRMGWELFI